MSLSPGSRIGPYQITAPLGAGGMGEVYRARDSKLNRDVAIKVLPAALAGDAHQMARFEREALILAALNHPNIATVFGVEEGALVMELVEGPDLCGPIPIKDAIPIARQIAEGLEAAHERGIIHRDLKPANIKVTAAGVVKILDFGLAKSGGDFSSGASVSNATLSPTLSLAMTQAGFILGTAAYMSPEQARGKPVDKRADIWAFGVVLYEMLTGEPLFGGGETVTDTLAAVVKDAPDLNKLPADTPPRIRRLLERCLRKDPKQRLRDIGEARLMLDEPEPEASAPVMASAGWIPWSVAGLLALALLVTAGGWLRSKTSGPGPGLGVSRFMIPLPAGTVWPQNNAATEWTPSPDGRNIAMIVGDGVSGKSALWLRPLDATSMHRLDRTDGAIYPFWSPDNQFIAFFAESKLKRIASSGGSVQTICDVPFATGGAAGDGGTWGPDGTIIFANIDSPLLRVSARGGIPQAITKLSADERGHIWPQFLPDGRHVLYLSRNEDAAKNAIYVQELGSTQRVRVLQNLTRAVWAPPGYLLFVRDATLLAQRMDPKTFQVEGEPLAIAQDVLANEGNGRSSFAVSQNGVLAFRSGPLVKTTQLTWRDRDGKIIGVAGQPGQVMNPSISPDEKSVALLVGGADEDVWVMDLATGVMTRMTRDGKLAGSLTPAWSADSQRLAAALRSGSGSEVIAVASGTITSLGKDVGSAEAWTPDGRSIICSSPDRARVSLLSLADPSKLQTIAETPYHQASFRLTPDGKYVAYASDESGAWEIYVASFPTFAVKRKVSDASGTHPVWANEGREIFYHGADGNMMDVQITTGSSIAATTPKPLFKFGQGVINRGGRFAVTADGKRFLTNEIFRNQEVEQYEIQLVLNWAADIK